ncbi:MAG: tRNA pseudouridine(38-40) synthase TruA, partial [Betaproteobacteria bacterium]|nr:tRNA pseudouridine(38-40) synthase TruA [Betaproteobacteria bacterium]
MPRIALRLAYDGSGYCGWQTQANRNSLQDELEAAIADIGCLWHARVDVTGCRFAGSFASPLT